MGSGHVVPVRIGRLATPPELPHTAATRTGVMLRSTAPDPAAASGACDVPETPLQGPSHLVWAADSHATTASPPTVARPHRLQWVNTPVLLEAIERFEQGRLPRSLTLWLSQLLELETPPSAPLRRGC